MRKLLFFLGFIVVLVIGLYVLAINMDWSIYKDEIRKEVENYSGRSLLIDGPIKLQMFPTPSLRMEKVRLTNQKGAETPDLIAADEALFEIELKTFVLSRKLRFTDAKLSGVILTIEAKDNEISNLYFALTSPKAELHRIQIDNGTLIIKRTDRDMGYKISTATIEASSFNGPYRFNANLLTNAGYVSFSGSSGMLARGNATPIELSIKHQKNDFLATLKGSFSKLNVVSGEFMIETQNLSEFLKVFEKSPLPIEQLGISGTLDVTPDQIKLEKIEGKMDGTTVKGSLTKGTQKSNVDLTIGKMKSANVLSNIEKLSAYFQVMGLNLHIEEVEDITGSIKDLKTTGSIVDKQFVVEKLSGNLVTGETHFTYNGKIDLKNDRKMMGTVSFAGKNLSEFVKWVPGLHPMLREMKGGEFRIEGMLQKDKEETVLSNAVIKKDKATVNGRISYSKEKMAVNAKLENYTVEGKREETSWKEALENMFKEALPLTKTEADLNLFISNADYKGLPVSGMTLILSSKDKTVNIQTMDGKVAEADVSVKGKIHFEEGRAVLADFNYKTSHEKKNAKVEELLKKYKVALPSYAVLKTNGVLNGSLDNLLLSITALKEKDRFKLEGRLRPEGYEGLFEVKAERADTVFSAVFDTQTEAFSEPLAANGVYQNGSVSELVFSVGGSEGKGQLSKREKRIVGALNFSVLDPKDILPAMNLGLVNVQDARIKPAYDEKPFGFERLKDSEIDVSIKANKMFVGETEIGNVKMTALLSGEGAQFKGVEGKIGNGGKLKADVSYKTADAKAVATVSLSEVAFPNFFRSSYFDVQHGTMNGEIRLNGKGKSEKEVMMNLEGEAKLALQNFILSGLALDPMSESKPYIINGRTPVERWDMDLVFEPGKILFGKNRLEAKTVTVDAKGAVDLVNHKYDVTMNVTPRAGPAYKVFVTDETKKTDFVRANYGPAAKPQGGKPQAKTEGRQASGAAVQIEDEPYIPEEPKIKSESPYAPQAMALMTETDLIAEESQRFQAAKGYKELAELIEAQKTDAERILAARAEENMQGPYNVMVSRMTTIRRSASILISFGLMEKIGLLSSQSGMLLKMIETEVRKDPSKRIASYESAEKLAEENKAHARKKSEAKIIQDLKDIETKMMANNAQMMEIYKKINAPAGTQEKR